MDTGKVYFVGAGPGHPGLITMRGVECLQQADAVLYDYLANDQLLDYAPEAAERICLGRHRRADIWPQQAINQAIVERAASGQIVVRLKGGDPLVFGRATEELDAVVNAGIPFEIVPGVTTASAAGAFAGVAMTDRNQASAVALVTGQERYGKSDSRLDYESLANFPGTLVIYMGVSTASEWSKALLDAGKPADTPVLIIRRCSWPDQLKLSCTLGNVTEHLTADRNIPPPAVVFVGPAADAPPAFDWFSRLPLRGHRVVVTRPRHQAGGMMRRLRELGADAICQPAIEISDPADWAPVDDVIHRLRDFDTLVFSSANGVHKFVQRILTLQLDTRVMAHCRLAVIGPNTADALATYGLRADVTPTSYRAEALAAALSLDDTRRRFLLLRASRGRDILADSLRANGSVEQIVVYESIDVTEPHAGTRDAIASRSIDWITVTSSAIAQSIVRLFGDHLAELKIASISPITSDTLRQCGHEPTVEATTYTADGVIEAMLTHASKSV